MQEEKAHKAAQDILDDLHGANFYEDLTILSGYLASTLGTTTENANRIAKAIQEDRNGANHFANIEILTDFLNISS